MSWSSDGDTFIMVITGVMDFGMHQEFRQAYEHASDAIQRYVIDLRNIARIDMSALGMLLLLRDQAGGDSHKVCLVNVAPDIRQFLTAVHFDELFTIAVTAPSP